MTAPDLTGLDLPAVFPPAGTYRSAVLHDGVLQTAGHIPLGADGTLVLGRLGEPSPSRRAGTPPGWPPSASSPPCRQELGSLDRVDRFLHVYGVVNATPEFVDHTAVIDAASDLFVQVFGDRGAHARLAVGVSSLPGQPGRGGGGDHRRPTLTYPARHDGSRHGRARLRRDGPPHRVVHGRHHRHGRHGRTPASSTRSGSGTARPHRVDRHLAAVPEGGRPGARAGRVAHLLGAVARHLHGRLRHGVGDHPRGAPGRLGPLRQRPGAGRLRPVDHPAVDRARAPRPSGSCASSPPGCACSPPP